MKTASISDIKKELSTLQPAKVQELCMRLAKYKKENKELLAYLLFEAHDEDTHIENVKMQMGVEFSELNKSNIYFAKKTIRKVLRTANKRIKFSKIDKTEIELRIYFCNLMLDSGLKMSHSTVLSNMLEGQIKKIKTTLEKMHEDLQFDYKNEVESLENKYI